MVPTSSVRRPGRAGPPPGKGAFRPRIVAAARRHFFAHGFRGVTMDDLAAELGASKKTLYAHFPSKLALLEAVLQAKFRDFEAEVARIAPEGPPDFAASLQRLLACVQRHTEEIQPPFLRDLRREAPAVFQVVEVRRRQVIRRHFGSLLEAGRRQGLVRKDVPLHLVIEILLAAVAAIMNPPRMAELGLTPQTGFSAILTVILHGVIRPQGRSSP